MLIAFFVEFSSIFVHGGDQVILLVPQTNAVFVTVLKDLAVAHEPFQIEADGDIQMSGVPLEVIPFIDLKLTRSN